jgi:hypothetical protein
VVSGGKQDRQSRSDRQFRLTAAYELISIVECSVAPTCA